MTKANGNGSGSVSLSPHRLCLHSRIQPGLWLPPPSSLPACVTTAGTSHFHAGPAPPCGACRRPGFRPNCEPTKDHEREHRRTTLCYLLWHVFPKKNHFFALLTTIQVVCYGVAWHPIADHCSLFSNILKSQLLWLISQKINVPPC